MKTINHEARQIGGTRSSMVTIAVLVTLGCWTQASDEIQANAPRRPAVAAEDQAAATRTARPEVWLCAGDRIAELCRPDAEWPFVKQHLTGIKFYVGQLTRRRRRGAEAQSDHLRQLVRLVRTHKLQVAVELGGCLDFSPLDDTAGEWSARHELAAIENFYAAGGKVNFLDIDGPIRRLMHPMKRRDGKRFDSIEKATDELVDALRIHREAHPETRYWLLTNFPNWGWRGEVSYHARGPQRQDYGDYDQVVRIVLDKLHAAEIPLDGVTVDNPYDYLTGEHRSVNLTDPTSVDWLGRVRTYENFARENGLTFNLIANSERGGHESDKRFHRETLRMVDAYLEAGGNPTRWFVQSWYPHPKQMLPESAPHSMTALARAVIQRVRSGAADSRPTKPPVSPQRESKPDDPAPKRPATEMPRTSRAPAPFERGERPNVLLIITDQQSGDAMSCQMGRQYINTPAMDSLAAEGVLFTRAYSSNPLCMPLRCSLFTGRYPHETGVTKNGRLKNGLDPDEFVMMGNYFRNAGYETAYSGKWHLCFNQKDASAHGFEILDSRTRLTPPEIDNYDSRVSHAAVRFLDREHEKPFLLVVSLMNPHNICEWARRASGREQTLSCGEIGTPPAADRLPPPPANLAPPKNEPDGMTLMRRGYHASPTFPVGNFTAEDWRRQRWGYYRMIEKVDGEIDKVLEALRQAGEESNTLVIFTSDHGDCTGAHRFNQKTVFYDESVRVPLIVSWKGKTVTGTSDNLVNTGIDVLPTMLDCARIEKPEKLPGRSLLPLALGQPVGPWRDYLVSQNHMAQAGEIDGFTPTMKGRMVRTDRYKYCVYSRGMRRESLVDMVSNPGETADLAGDPKYREVLLEHREVLARFGRKHNDPLVAELLADDVKPIPFAPASPTTAGDK